MSKERCPGCWSSLDVFELILRACAQVAGPCIELLVQVGHPLFLLLWVKLFDECQEMMKAFDAWALMNEATKIAKISHGCSVVCWRGVIQC